MPLPTWPHPLNLNPFLQFPIPYTGCDPLSGGCTWDWENPTNLKGFRGREERKGMAG